MQNLVIFTLLSLLVAAGALFCGLKSGDLAYTGLGICIVVLVTILILAVWNHGFRKRKL
ncbi:hypothetical protein GCM10010329_11430 [Streptomyces spiroverticillatus]|uniref:hypothetical protein n=1 Tax=Streptomyces finlayi TaxID=67296 RepID=UPI0016749300|nr:hypothetical protein [Streptomyces finlayi]GGZ92491.1 hypothetical protein GCM10010329_11430 [Streptomyces spiroverticillatus]